MALFATAHARHTAVAVAVATVLLALAGFEYLPAITTGGYVYEDQSSILDTVINVRGPIAPLRTRALTRLSYRFDAWWGHGDARAFHFTNLALHLVNTALVWQIALAIVPGYSLVAAAMFLLHPLQVEAVAYGAGRTEVLSLTFLLLAWLAVLPALTKRRLVACALLLGCAMWAKESAVCGVWLIGLYLALYYPRAWRAYRFLRWQWAALPIGLGLVVGLIAWSTLHFEHLYTADLPRPTYMAVQAVALWRFLRIVVLPYGQSIDHDFLIAPAWLAWLTLYLTVCAASLWGVLALFQVRRAIVLAYGWVLGALVLRFVMRIPEALNEHQMYTAMVGLSLGAALLAGAIDRWLTCRAERRSYAVA